MLVFSYTCKTETNFPFLLMENLQMQSWGEYHSLPYPYWKQMFKKFHLVPNFTSCGFIYFDSAIP